MTAEIIQDSLPAFALMVPLVFGLTKVIFPKGVRAADWRLFDKFSNQVSRFDPCNMKARDDILIPDGYTLKLELSGLDPQITIFDKTSPKDGSLPHASCKVGNDYIDASTSTGRIGLSRAFDLLVEYLGKNK